MLLSTGVPVGPGPLDVNIWTVKGVIQVKFEICKVWGLFTEGALCTRSSKQEAEVGVAAELLWMQRAHVLTVTRVGPGAF